MLVVFSVYFSTLISKNCSLISTSQLFPPESSSQFSTQTAYWDQKTTFYTEPLTYRPHGQLHAWNYMMTLQSFLRKEKNWPAGLKQQKIKQVWPNAKIKTVKIYSKATTTFSRNFVPAKTSHYTVCRLVYCIVFAHDVRMGVVIVGVVTLGE